MLKIVLGEMLRMLKMLKHEKQMLNPWVFCRPPIPTDERIDDIVENIKMEINVKTKSVQSTTVCTLTESNFPVKLNQINPLPPQRQLVALSDTSITGHLHFLETALGGQPIWYIFGEEYKLKKKSWIRIQHRNRIPCWSQIAS